MTPDSPTTSAASRGCHCVGGCENTVIGGDQLCPSCQQSGCLPYGPTRWRDKLFWRLGEDREWRHVLEDEWNGNAGGNTIWSRYVDTTNDVELSWGVMWSNCGFGPSYETGHESVFIPSTNIEVAHRVETRRTFIGFSLGPLHLSLMIHRPRRGFEPR